MPITTNIFDVMNGAIPHFLRKPVFSGYVSAISKPIEDIKGRFSVFRDYQRWLLDHNSQIVYLEHFLNDYFGLTYDPATRDDDIISGSIVWIDSQNKLYHFEFNKIEGRPKRILYNKAESGSPIYLKNFSELIATSHFIVNIPVAVTFTETVVRSKIDFFKLASKTYSIQTY